MFDLNILEFYKSLQLKVKLPKGVSFMNPYLDTKTFETTTLFYQKFYHDNEERKIIFGINPGRFGGGVTGIPFTDPINLERFCGIENHFDKKPELSSSFIYQMIDTYGGVEMFYKSVYFSALSPLGFVREKKNLNYYDVPQLNKAVEPFMLECLRKQLNFNISKQKAYCLGEGENYRYLNGLNEKYNFFKEITPLPHPRFIMQYKRKHLMGFIDKYVGALK